MGVADQKNCLRARTLCYDATVSKVCRDAVGHGVLKARNVAARLGNVGGASQQGHRLALMRSKRSSEDYNARRGRGRNADSGHYERDPNGWMGLRHFPNLTGTSTKRN